MEQLFDILCQVCVPLGLLLVGWLAGGAAERGHLRSLDQRERKLEDILVTDLKSFPGAGPDTQGATMVLGQAVIATDYLKTFLANIRKIFGGELLSYQTLLSRARREAMVRMLTEARRQDCDAVCNLRMDSADIGGSMGTKGAAMVEVLASGTAYRRDDTAA